MTIEAMKQALEALEESHPEAYRHVITSLRQAIEQAEKQEPVAWMIWLYGLAGLFEHKQLAEYEFERRNKEYPNVNRKLLPLYTTPQQREWKELTDDEMDDIWNRYCDELGEASINDAPDIARAIEAILRSKNT